MKNVECIGFVPRRDFEIELHKRMDQILASCPSDASARATAAFTDDRFVFELVIHSLEGRFRSSVGVPIPRRKSGDRLWQKTALDQIADEIGGQLTKWRGRRFKDKEIRRAA